jgi:16S rRNA processing protein RimM
LEVGRVLKAHGLTGEVEVSLVTDRLERVAVGSVLHAGGHRLEVVGSRPHKGHHLVHFAGVVGREAAEALRGTVLSAPPLDDPGTVWVHEVIGARVVDVHGVELGTVTAVEANPASDLLVLDGGGLVPLVFMVASEPGCVTVDVPPGLLE